MRHQDAPAGNVEASAFAAQLATRSVLPNTRSVFLHRRETKRIGPVSYRIRLKSSRSIMLPEATSGSW